MKKKITVTPHKKWTQLPENLASRVQSEPEWFTTPEAAKTLDMRTVTLQDLIVRGFVAPQERGVGYGSKHHFSRVGLIQIRLFTYLVENGLSRKEASKRVFRFREICEQQKPLEHGYLLFSRNGDQISVGFLSESERDEQGNINIEIPGDVEEAHMINLGMIIDDVDRRIEMR